MATKRGRDEMELEEFNNVCEISQPSPKAKVHAVVSMISLMKKGGTCSYFDGELTDGKARMRLFGFNGDVRRKLMEEGNSSPVVISNCEVKKARRGEQLEVCAYYELVIFDNIMPLLGACFKAY